MNLRNHRFAFLMFLCGVALAWIRVSVSWNELWLDEVWSLGIARDVDRLLDLFVHGIDNNHPLNTAFLAMLGAPQPGWVYRLPAVLCSVATLGVAARIGWVQARFWTDRPAAQRTSAFVALLLVGLSYPLVLLGTEARGYSALVLFSLLLWWAVLESHRDPRLRWVAVYSVAGALALLSHATALFLLVAVGVYQLSCCLWERRRLAVTASRLWRWHKWTGLATLLLVALFWSHLQIAGGDPWTYTGVLKSTVSLTLGLPEAWAGWVGVPLLLLGAGAGAVLLGKKAPRLLGLYLLSVLLVPNLLLTVRRPVYLSFRYFVGSVALGLLFLSMPLAWSLAQKGKGRIVAVLLLSLYAGGNLLTLRQLDLHGRGSCRPLLHFVRQSVKAQSLHRQVQHVRVAYDHAVRTQKVLRYYASKIETHSPIRFEFVSMYDRKSQRVPWLIQHDTARRTKPMVYHHYRDRYIKVLSTDSAPGNGMKWYLYKHQPRSSSPSR